MSSRAQAPGTTAVRKRRSRKAISPIDRGNRALAHLDNYRNDRLLEAVAFAAKGLLRSPDLNVSLPKVTEQIGQAAGVDRAHIILVGADSDDGRFLQHHVWSVPGIATPPEFHDTTTSMANVGLKSWIPRLRRGETIVGHTRDFDVAARPLFDLGGVKSVLCVPVFADGQWQGLIGFDDCRSERDWSATEIDTIKTLAELVGAAMARTSRLQTLADTNRIIENSPTILYRLSPRPPFDLIYLSQNVRRYGYEAEKLLTSPGSWMHLIDSDSHPAIAADIKAIIEGKTEHTLIEFRLKKADGCYAWFEGRGYPVRDEQRRLVAIEGILTDITERKRSESELSFSHSLLTTAIENSPDAILVVDASDRITMFNRRFAEMWNIPTAALQAGIDEPVLNAVRVRMKDQDKFIARVRYLYAHPELQGHDEIETTDGLFFERQTRSLYDAQQKYLGRIWFFHDITESKRFSEQITAFARTDALTGLANRPAFLDRLALEFARARRDGHQFAVHYLDLDHFKDVNDTLGHPVGDALLRAVGERIRGCVRETDMVARFGGDEFAVLQDDISNVADVETLAAKIGNVIARPYAIDGNQVETTASIGIVPYRGDIASVDAIMMKADLALYRAKNEGRNQFRFHVTELDEQTRERMLIGEELRHAIAGNEFELYYQPQVNLASGVVVGLEALIRWNHPKRGLLLPAAFIPIAETNGCIVPIGEWVIERACQQIKQWNDLAIAPPVVGVNLSGAQFKLASQLDQIVTDRLTYYRIAPERLELELTESVLIETTERHSEVLDKLRKIGVRLAIDDFGTGYSSLDYLRMFHVSRLKIDQRFIKHALVSSDDAAIVRATIGLAHALGIEVVAEGVETAGQRDFLIEAGCKIGQGYFLGRPMPAGAATALLSKAP